jgi:hypothetical protein
MSLTIIKPTTITPALLASTTVAEVYAEWASGTTYAADARCTLASTRRTYQSLQAGNTGHNPASAAAWWVDVGASNQWAMFDGALGSATESADGFSVVVRPGVVSAVAVMQVQAESVRVRMLDAPGGAVVYDRTQGMGRAFISNWYEWTTAPFEYQPEAIFQGLPMYAACELQVTFAADTLNPARCGEMVAGVAYTLGVPQMGTKLGITDYSRKVTDEWGNTTLVQRAFAKTLDVPLVLDAEQLAKAYGLLANLRATPCVFVPSALTRYSALVIYGWIGEFTIDLATYTMHYCNLQIKGLT